jgi:hypothetical protein
MAVLLAAVKALESANAALQVELNGWDDYRSCGCWMLPEEAGEMNYTVIFRLLDSWRDELERNYQAVAETKPTKPTRPPAT